MFFESLRVSLKSSFVKRVEAELNQIWNLGRNVIVGWAHGEGGLVFVSCPNYHLPTALAPFQNLPVGTAEIPRVLLSRMARDARFGLHRFKLAPGEDDLLSSTDLLDRVLRRYGIVLAENRAAVLFDIVGYSKLSPLEQVAQLNSLSYSVNISHKRLLERGLAIDLARSTTGDGFYMWNRDTGHEANLRLYALTMLTLADNALALTHTPNPVVPRLRTAFHIGSHFEFYEAVGFTPETREYIVGDTTIRLARFLERAQGGQILIGDFEARDENGDLLDSDGFLARVSDLLARLPDLQMAHAKVRGIQVYLTGRRGERGEFVPTRYAVQDKHGNRFPVFNARCVVDRTGQEKLFVGLRHPETPVFRPVEAAA